MRGDIGSGRPSSKPSTRPSIARRAALGLVAAAAATYGCAAAPTPGNPRFLVNDPVAPVYQGIAIRVEGLRPGEAITITSSTRDADGRLWQAHGVYTASASGEVDLTRQAPTEGTYRAVDAMGLLWSMNLAPGQKGPSWFTYDLPEKEPSFRVALSATDGTAKPATATLVREWMAPGVTHRAFTLAADGVIGDLYLPRPNAKPRPAVILLGGSEGGESERSTAAVLAGEGYPALAVAYFHEPGLPDGLANIPLEYFATAARRLAVQPGVDSAHILILGASRGSEAALLAADEFPTLIHGAIVYAPSAIVNAGFTNTVSPARTTAWTLHGTPLPTGLEIPLSNVSGPVLAFAGSDDALWDSPDWAHAIGLQLQLDGDSHPYQVVVYPDAGHGVAGDVDLPGQSTTGVEFGHPIDFGGTRQADSDAQQAAWTQTLALLASLQH